MKDKVNALNNRLKLFSILSKDCIKSYLLRVSIGFPVIYMDPQILCAWTGIRKTEFISKSQTERQNVKLSQSIGKVENFCALNLCFSRSWISHSTYSKTEREISELTQGRSRPEKRYRGHCPTELGARGRRIGGRIKTKSETPISEQVKSLPNHPV